MTRKPIGVTVPYRKIGCVQHDCERCQRGWVGLTDEEMEKISVENGKATFLNDDEETDILWFDVDCFALLKAAEAKLKQKNTIIKTYPEKDKT